MLLGVLTVQSSFTTPTPRHSTRRGFGTQKYERAGMHCPTRQSSAGLSQTALRSPVWTPPGLPARNINTPYTSDVRVQHLRRT